MCRLRLAAILFLLWPCAEAAQKANVKGPDFPIAGILLTAAIVLVVSLICGGAVAWKSELVERSLSSGFAAYGKVAGRHPIKTISGAVLLMVVLGGGMAMQKDETDPYRLWVPADALGMDHRAYVEKTWPSEAQPQMTIALPPSGKVGEEMLTPAYMNLLHRDYMALMSNTVDGDQIRTANDNCCPEYAGKWTYTGEQNTNPICFQAGGQCKGASIFALFNYDKAVIESLTRAELLQAVNDWDRTAMYDMVPGQGARSPAQKTFDIDAVLGQITRDANTHITGAKAHRQLLMTKYNSRKETAWADKEKPSMIDPIVYQWTADMVCDLGMAEDYPGKKTQSCTAPAGVSYFGFTSRSMSDTFGDLIRGDISKIIISYYLMIFYLFISLGKRDGVHSMIGMSCVAVACVGFSFASASGLAALFQVKNNPLNMNIVFLLLGLGVDDAFVLASEFYMHSLQNPELAVEDRIMMTAKSGGLSVLVTSSTDAMAFLIGSSTKLPALSAFCIYAGLGVSFCFVFMMILFLPALALNARRADGNRLDCICCVKVEERKLSEPRGCCACIPFCPAMQPGDFFLQRTFRSAGQYMTKVRPFQISVVVAYFVLFVVGVIGLCLMETNFELEWFVGEENSVRKYMDLNKQLFSQGINFDVYLKNVDLYQKQDAMYELSDYLSLQEFITEGSIDDWWRSHRTAHCAVNSCKPTDKLISSNANDFYNAIWSWYKTPNNRHARNIQWVHSDCNTPATWNSCDASKGIQAARIPAMMTTFKSGEQRFNTLHTFRKDLNAIIGDDSGMTLFPYTTGFLTWEEVGIIKEELVRNLIIASGVICVIVCLLIPAPRISLVVILNIFMSVVEVVGMAHFWGQYFNGVTTIYFLICVGLGVDYSAHIGHYFKDGKGTSAERALEALTRIGPSVFNALTSTILAVFVLAFAKSFVFEVFFRILLLVTLISGSHGLLLLPILLALFGGDAPVSDKAQDAETGVTVAEKEAPDTNQVGAEAIGC